MALYEEHRIYSYLNEPLRILGLTIDELILGFTGLSLGVYVDTLILKLLFIGGGIGGMFIIKRIKRLILGFSLSSFLYWHIGLNKNLFKLWPKSHYKDWLS